MKFFAHVFPNQEALIAHMRDAFDSGALVVNRINRSYEDVHRTHHRCFVVRVRDDVNLMLGFVFQDSHVHEGHHEFMNMDDMDYLYSMLRSRTRKEVA